MEAGGKKEVGSGLWKRRAPGGIYDSGGHAAVIEGILFY